MQELQAQIQQLREETLAMRLQIDAMRQQLESLRGAGSPTDRKTMSSEEEGKQAVESLSDLAEKQQLLDAKLDEQDQTKVESGSRYRLRLSGLALMNAFSTRGSVDNLDLPRIASTRKPGDSNGSFGASARQSRIDLEVFGSEFKAIKARGDMSFDFWGGFPTSTDGLSSGLIRLRTATLAFDSEKTSVVMGQDAPFFSPRSPTSLASSAYPSLSSAGNLWVWTPQSYIERRFAASDSNSFSIQGILDPLTGEVPSEYDRTATAGERSRAPAFATRLGWKRARGDRGTEAGTGAYYSRQNWGFGRTVDAWAITGDWDLPLGKWFSLSGELYRGRSIAGLGGGASGSVVFKGVSSLASSSVLPLNNVGGWSQIKFKPIGRMEFNAAFGEDQPFRQGLSSLLNLGIIDGQVVNRNSSGFFNVIYQARSNLLFSVEYRRLWTFGLTESKHIADHISITSGIVF
jgi:hypothetical protein